MVANLILQAQRQTTNAKMGPGTPRPLSELSPMTQRRNSPSWNQPGKVPTIMLYRIIRSSHH